MTDRGLPIARERRAAVTQGPVDPAAPVCRFCGKGPDDELGCIVRACWDFELADYRWQHNACAVGARWSPLRRSAT